MTTWLVTGGCGFIGVALARRLLAEGIRVRALDNLSLGRADALPEGAELVRADVRDAQACVRAAEGASVIVHLAANTGVMPSLADPRLDCEVNVAGILNVLEAARAANVPRFVFASSGAPLGPHTPPIHEEMAPHPMSPYGASKLAGEGYCSAYWHSFGVAAVALRFGNVYGPGSGHKQSVVARFLKDGLAGRPLEVHGDGDQTRDFLFIDDLIAAVLLSARADGLGGEVLHIATGTERTVNELASRIADLLFRRTGRRPEIAHRDSRPGEMKRNFADIAKARRLLGFCPQTSLDEGLARTLDYFLAAAAHDGAPAS